MGFKFDFTPVELGININFSVSFIKGCVKKTFSFVFSLLLSQFLIFPREILGDNSPIN